MSKYRVSGDAARARSVLLKLGMAVVLIAILAGAASAYTLVFRSGQRLEIPDEFTVTRTTLTYELAPGFQKTILVSLIDIGATERANHEPWGSFLKHRQQSTADPQPQQSATTAQSSTPAVRTVTNDDLIGFRQRRIESEMAYEKRRLQLGLPTVAESRRRQAADEANLHEQLREKASANRQEESYWKNRARELRTEIAMVDNQIGFVRGRLNELEQYSSRRQTWTSTYPIWPYYDPSMGNGRWGRRGSRPPRVIFGPQNPYGYPNQYPNGYPNQYPGYPNQYPNGYPNQYPNGYPNQYPGYPNQYPGYPNQYPNGYPNQYPGYPSQNPYGYPQYPYGYPNQYPTVPYDNSQESAARERDDLTSRLNDLLVRRAGLATQWQALEDEARDARVPQVWLEP